MKVICKVQKPNYLSIEYGQDNTIAIYHITVRVSRDQHMMRTHSGIVFLQFQYGIGNTAFYFFRLTLSTFRVGKIVSVVPQSGLYSNISLSS